MIRNTKQFYKYFISYVPIIKVFCNTKMLNLYARCYGIYIYIYINRKIIN